MSFLLVFAATPVFADDGETTSQVVVVGDIVIGNGASAGNGDMNTAVGASVQIVNGQGNYAENYGALAVGGDGNTAIGYNAQVISGDNNKAIGFGAIAGGGNNNTAIGRYAYAIGTENTAIGYNALATGGSSVAIGAYSVATEPMTVSVGQPGYERRIQNVAPGILDTDAVNVSQLRGVDSKVNRVGAMAFAFSALAPMAYDPKDPTQYSAGIGTYNGKTAIALGVYHYTKETVMLNAAIGYSDDGWEKSGRVGVTWRMGKNNAPKTPEQVSVSNVKQPETDQASSSGTITERINKILREDG
jgi:autotransporter adhesin